MKKDLKIEFLRADNGEFYWHVKSANGKLIATSGETFKRKGSARKSFERMAWAITRQSYKLVEKW